MTRKRNRKNCRRDLYMLVCNGTRQLITQNDALGVPRFGLVLANDYESARAIPIKKEKVVPALIGSIQGETIESVLRTERSISGIEGAWLFGQMKDKRIIAKWIPWEDLWQKPKPDRSGPVTDGNHKL